MNLETLLAHLNGVRQSGNGFVALCPAHPDNKPSLSVCQGDNGGILVKCHVGCTADAICKALSLTVPDLMPPTEQGQSATARPRIAETYDYTDEEGVSQYQVARMIPKAFFQRQPDGKGGWINNLTGVRRIPYRLQQVIEAVASGVTVWIVEGEKDVHALELLGLVATTNAGGAGKWLPEWSGYFPRAQVVVLPDNDEPGRRHGSDVAASLRGVAASVRVVELPDLPEKGDVSDWLRNGGTGEALERLAYGCPEWEPTAHSQDDGAGGTSPATEGCLLLSVAEFLKSVGEPPPMLVEGILPDRSLVLLSGKPKYGKSLCALDIAESVALGERVWGTRTVTRPGPVVYLGMEDGKFEIARRLLGRGLSQTSTLPVFIRTERIVLGTVEGVEALKAAVLPLSPSLVIVDTARESLGIKDTSDPSEQIERLRPLRDFSREVCTVLLVAHNRKAEAADAVDEIAGSNGFTSAVDGWISARRKEDREEDGTRIRRLHLDIDGRGGMRGSIVVEMDCDTFRFREVTEEEQRQERGEARAEAEEARCEPLLAYLRTKGASTISEISLGTRLHERKVRRLLDELVKTGRVSNIDRSAPGNASGRPAHVYDIVIFGQHPMGDGNMSESQKPVEDPWGDEPEEF
jgi:putative DNA primase/helicase